MTQILTLIDISGVQSYLFSSNRLRHNQTASYLVTLASTEWAQKICADHAGSVIYAAGGNAALIFPSIDTAKKFAHDYTCELLIKAPGMRVVVHHTAFETGRLAIAFNQASKGIAQAKVQQPIGLPLPGLSVTAACDYTGLPAVNKDGEGRWMSAELAAKEQRVNEARKHVAKPFELMLKDLEFAYDFNELGSHGDSSFMAVIHIDGNGMGRRKQAIVDECAKQADDNTFIKRMSAFSHSVVAANEAALKHTVQTLISWIDRDAARRDMFLFHDHDGTHLKFVPIVTGGDDTTLVCDGRLGLSLAALYLNKLSSQTVENKPYWACAGVAITGNRFPFRRAYSLAEELCKNAKTALKEKGSEGMALDWHIATSGVIHALNEIRKREYKVDDGSLCNRPLFLHQGVPEWQSVRGFFKVVDEFQNGAWASRRNKLKALRETLRKGGQATENYRALLGLPKFPELDGAMDALETGWHGGTCLYFDAIEVMDLFEQVEAKTEASR